MTEDLQPTAVAPTSPGSSVPGDLHAGGRPYRLPGSYPPPGQFPNNFPMTPKELGSIGWALAPLLTIGMAAAPCFAYAAVRARRWALGLAAAGYAAVSGFVVWGGAWNSDGNVQINLGVVAVLLLWGGSTAHALAIRRSLFFGDEPEDDAILAAKERLRRRDESRRIVATDPRLAKELRIGRPDQPSSYDDGGLVDVNHVPAHYLSGLGLIGPDLALRIVEARDLVGGFDNRSDLEAVLGLDPRSLDDASDLLIFCR